MVIVASGYPIKIGTRGYFKWLINNVESQPGVVMKESTKEEYIKYCTENCPRRSREDVIQALIEFDRKYFYEVSTD